MSVVDLHPEDLLDKDARGALTSDERVRLEGHLARCSACRAERVLRADFADELDGEDRPSAILGLVKGALAAPRPATTSTTDATVETAAMGDTTTASNTAKRHDVNGMPELDAIPSLRRRPRRTAVFLLVAAAVLAAGAAGATGVTARVWRSIGGGSLDATHASATSIPTSPPADPARATIVRPGSPAASATSDALETAAAPPVAPVACATPPAPRAFAPALPPAPAPVLASAPAPALAPASASALFESANAARRTGDTATALVRYDALEKQFPGTRESRVAKATTAKLLLDRGDAAGALSRFDAYLASGSNELREEAMAGRATALERLGRDDDESRAWAALLATYPRTPYAAHARARVGRSVPQ